MKAMNFRIKYWMNQEARSDCYETLSAVVAESDVLYPYQTGGSAPIEAKWPDGQWRPLKRRVANRMLAMEEEDP